MKQEIRVYAIDPDDSTGWEEVESMTDEQFIDEAERQNLCWSIKGFQEAFNRDCVSDQWFIKFLPIPYTPLPETGKQVITRNGEVLPMNETETEVFHFGTWKEIQEDQDGELYIMGGLNSIYIDYLTPVQKPTPSANELESSEMERAIVDVPAEAADVYEYLDGEDGNFASEPAPEGWETGIAPTPGNERESGEGWTPGEWKIIDHLVYVGDIDKDFKNIALCGYDKKEESEANARLIAHSKKLYYALKEVSNYFEEQTPEVNEEGSSAYEFYRKIKSILNSINKQ